MKHIKEKTKVSAKSRPPVYIGGNNCQKCGGKRFFLKNDFVDGELKFECTRCKHYNPYER